MRLATLSISIRMPCLSFKKNYWHPIIIYNFKSASAEEDALKSFIIDIKIVPIHNGQKVYPLRVSKFLNLKKRILKFKKLPRKSAFLDHSRREKQ